MVRVTPFLYRLPVPAFLPVSFPPSYRGRGNRGKVRQSRFGSFRESRENRKAIVSLERKEQA